MAQVVDRESLESLREPKSGVDEAAIEAYVDWVEEKDFSQTSFNWLKLNKFEIATDIKEDELISVQITYDSGWRVESGGKRLKTYQDPIGNLVIDPLGQTGELKITAIYIDRIDVWLGYLSFITTVVILIFFRKRVKIILLGNQKKE